ncbi:hypothetical protein CAPTEDRAFT_97284 [Capitella teleta]|uniref:SUN domain-containing protein n=1 Tax=Capitella teleta TaxID=283909 RepID=R7TLF7_CAPTE|nr:hypothetical protein CAPTEDRAFT_97284 [Capitella teleta]|eukprot:ELT94317.1 hypothetical protein CAPTEDRAFT_97284 [Capitella teleta]
MEEEEIVAQEAGEDMVSFDEWKKKRLAEQAQLDRKEGGSKSPTNTPSQSKVKTSKNRINFASATCGAKILTSNNGAQNPAYLLTENKDQYMINSCKAKKWFIVELCEPVQVHSIELGNLELFSSLPQEFVASISDRYPSKEWKSLGVFHAREERSIQSFSVGENPIYAKYLKNPIYAKYLKVEMITHYGHEHFCTLSILRSEVI